MKADNRQMKIYLIAGSAALFGSVFGSLFQIYMHSDDKEIGHQEGYLEAYHAIEAVMDNYKPAYSVADYAVYDGLNWALSAVTYNNGGLPRPSQPPTWTHTQIKEAK